MRTFWTRMYQSECSFLSFLKLRSQSCFMVAWTENQVIKIWTLVCPLMLWHFYCALYRPSCSLWSWVSISTSIASGCRCFSGWVLWTFWKIIPTYLFLSPLWGALAIRYVQALSWSRVSFLPECEWMNGSRCWLIRLFWLLVYFIDATTPRISRARAERWKSAMALLFVIYKYVYIRVGIGTVLIYTTLSRESS